MSIQERQQKLVDEFARLENWDDKYRKIIELGKALPELPAKYRTEDFKVKGCQSQVWLAAELSPSQRIVLFADSDALIVKGLVALLLNVYSDSPPSEILASPPDFVKALGLQSNLSPSRSNGLFSMIKQISHFASAFDYLLKSKK